MQVKKCRIKAENSFVFRIVGLPGEVHKTNPKLKDAQSSLISLNS